MLQSNALADATNSEVPEGDNVILLLVLLLVDRADAIDSSLSSRRMGELEGDLMDGRGGSFGRVADDDGVFNGWADGDVDGDDMEAGLLLLLMEESLEVPAPLFVFRRDIVFLTKVKQNHQRGKKME